MDKKQWCAELESSVFEIFGRIYLKNQRHSSILWIHWLIYNLLNLLLCYYYRHWAIFSHSANSYRYFRIFCWYSYVSSHFIDDEDESGKWANYTNDQWRRNYCSLTQSFSSFQVATKMNSKYYFQHVLSSISRFKSINEWKKRKCHNR